MYTDLNVFHTYLYYCEVDRISESSLSSFKYIIETISIGKKRSNYSNIVSHITWIYNNNNNPYDTLRDTLYFSMFWSG